MATYDELLEQGNDILAADALVDAGANYKLPAWMNAALTSIVSEAGVRQDEKGLAEGTRRAASDKVKAAYVEGQQLLREFNRFVNNINDNQDVVVDIPAARDAYGLGRVLSSDLTHPKVKEMLQRIGRVGPTFEPAAVRPRASVLARVEAILGTIETHGTSAGIGNRASLTGDKDAAQKSLEALIARVRYFLWSGLPEMFKDPLLHNYGFVPRQESETERAQAPTAS